MIIKGRAYGIPGATGSQGPAGPQGPPGPVGAEGLEWKGAWNSSTAYVNDDAVAYNGASYFCINPNTNTPPTGSPTDTNWALLASQGATGPQGPQGIQGEKGDKGDQGIQGIQGAQGLQGPQGLTGPQGDAGPQGAKGDTGNTGATGSQGPIGNTGPQGVKGDTGDTGSQGVAGPTGATGPKGDTGATGSPGATGATGAQGVGLSPGTPATISVSFGAAARPADTTKPYFISVSIDATYTVAVAGTVTDVCELWIGPLSTVGTTGGTRVCSWRGQLTGILTLVGAGIGLRSPLSALVPAGWYFAIRRTTTGTATINESTYTYLT
ncbi:hypothetical protein H4F83_05680 [Citrobacter freundii]|nr:hypothetical protein [Citrobacter freundii]